jgi:hypothetical protein
LAVAVGLLVGLVPAGAAPAYLYTPDFVTRTWQSAEGMPENSATSIAQTPDGYLWVGTFSGLTRFDGTELELVTDPAEHAYFGIAGVMKGNGPEPPRDLSLAAAPFLEGPAPEGPADLAGRLATRLGHAVRVGHACCKHIAVCVTHAISQCLSVWVDHRHRIRLVI